MKHLFIKALLPLVLSSRLALSSPIVGYGSTGAVLSPTDQAVFYMGFELGFKSTLKKTFPKDGLLVINSPDRGELAPAKVAQELVAKEASLLAGFPTSHEALLMGETGKKQKILAIAAAAGHSKMAEFGNSVFTCGESMQSVSRFFLDSILERYSGKKGLLIINPKSAYSADQQKSIQKELAANKKYQSLQLETLAVMDPKTALSSETQQRLLRDDYDYLIVAMYPEDSGPLLATLDERKKHVPLLTTTWTTGEVEMLRQILSRYRAPIFSSSIWILGNPESKEFEYRVRRALGREPSSEIAYAYDLGVIVATVINRTKGKYSKDALLRAFHRDLCFPNTSNGTVCFDPRGGHLKRKMYLSKYTKDKGFVPLSGR